MKTENRLSTAIAMTSNSKPEAAAAQNAIVKRSTIEPETLNDILTFANIAMKSQYFGVRNVEEAAVRILYGKEMGLSVMQSMMGVTIIQGRPGLSAGMIAAKVKQSGKYDYQFLRWDNQVCELQFFEYGKPKGTSIFTIQDARAAGLLKQGGNWEKYPRAMLFNRAVTQGVRAHAPDIFLGSVYTPDELQEDTGEADLMAMETATVTASQDAIIEAEIVEPTPTPTPEPVQPARKAPARPKDEPGQPLNAINPEVVTAFEKWVVQMGDIVDMQNIESLKIPAQFMKALYGELFRRKLVPSCADNYAQRRTNIAKISSNWADLWPMLEDAFSAVLEEHKPQLKQPADAPFEDDLPPYHAEG